MYTCVYIHVGLCTCEYSAFGVWKRVLDSLDLKLQVVVSCLIWVPELEFSARTVHPLNY